MARSLSKSQIPLGWKYELLDRVASRCSGHTPSKSHDEYWDGGVKWISLTDSHRLDKGYVYDTGKKISKLGIKNSSAEVHPQKTVVLSRDAGIGKSGVMAEPMAVSQHFIAWKCDNREIMDSWFLYNWLQLHKPEFERQAVGSTIKTIGLPYFKKLKIAFPPINEQRKIAKILSAWDEAIATTEQLLANSEQQKKALMQQLLTGKKRLPGFEMSWREVTLGELLEERNERGIEGLSLLSVTANQGVIYRNDVGRKDTSSDDKSKYLKVCKGDIAYNTMRMWQGVSALSNFEGIVSPAYTVLKPTKAVDPRFASYLFKLPAMIHKFYRHSQGLVSDTWNLKYNKFTRIKALVPEVSEQREIAKTILNQDRAITVIEKELEQLKNEKKALMQQLLTGKRRVKTEEEVA